MPTVSPTLEITKRKQQTISKPVFFSGIGIHTGQLVNLCFRPMKEGTGIVFRRMDYPGQPIIPARLEYVQDTSRSTTIGIKDVRIHTVEHVLAAVKAHNIDNLCIEVSNIEPPVGNGSSDIFVSMIEEAGIQQQEAFTPIVKITKPLYLSEGDINVVAIPYDGYRVSYTLSYPDSRFLRGQFHSVFVNAENFKNEIAPCRTFSLYKEIALLIDRGLIKGGSLDNAVVIKDDAILSKNGLFFPDEMARHKILDLIGDLSLIGFDFHAHIMAIRSGHGTNVAFAKIILNYLTHGDA